MDDSWDVPLDGNSDYYGSLILNAEKFPSYTDTSPGQALKKLKDDITKAGWKSLGGWVCAQESPLFPASSQEEYWIERLKWADEAGFAYWKVDWGKHCDSPEFRKMLSKLGREYAPNLTIEQAGQDTVIPFCDAFRTYDVRIRKHPD